jgi:hypothetical protein
MWIESHLLLLPNLLAPLVLFPRLCTGLSPSDLDSRPLPDIPPALERAEEKFVIDQQSGEQLPPYNTE